MQEAPHVKRNSTLEVEANTHEFEVTLIYIAGPGNFIPPSGINGHSYPSLVSVTVVVLMKMAPLGSQGVDYWEVWPLLEGLCHGGEGTLRIQKLKPGPVTHCLFLLPTDQM